MDGKKTVVLGWLLNEIKNYLKLSKVYSGTYKIYLCGENTDFNMDSKIEAKLVNGRAIHLSNKYTIIRLSSEWLLDNEVPLGVFNK
jgi:hypothetical protein